MTEKYLDKKALFKIAGVSQYSQFEKFIKDILFDKEKREAFYRKILAINNNVSHDSFTQFFQDYSAEQKNMKQDFTPSSIADLISTLVEPDKYNVTKADNFSGYDPAAGTGALIIAKWFKDQRSSSIFTYAPHDYLYLVEELADNAIPYLLHNLAIRGMNCIVIHGDTLTRKAKQVYFAQNSKDDFLGFSDINVMPHSKTVEDEFDIREWTEPAINHIESGRVVYVTSKMELMNRARGINEK